MFPEKINAFYFSLVAVPVGKTLGFLIPLLIRTSDFLIFVTLLTLSGDEHMENLMEAEIVRRRV